MRNWQDYYQALGVDPDASEEEIKNAFHYKCQTAHPDKVPEKFKQRAAAEFRRIKEAYETLKDPEKRRQYHEEWLQKAGQAPTFEAPKPRPVATPPSIRFSGVSAGDVQRGSFVVQNEGGPYEQIWFSNPDSWVRISDYQSIDPSDELPLQIEIEAVGEEWERHSVEYITVRLDDQEVQVKVELQTRARPAPRPQPTAQPAAKSSPTRPSAKARTVRSPSHRVKHLCEVLWTARKIVIPVSLVFFIIISVGLTWLFSSPPLAFQVGIRVLAVSSTGMIAYSGGYNKDIYLLSSSGKVTKIMSTPNEREDDLAWSPDGSMLAYVKNYDIYVYHLSGSYTEKVKISADLRCSSPTWSPDGKKLAFVGDRMEIYVLDLVHGNLLQLTQDETYKASLAWSPDGKRIALVLYHGGNSEIYTVGADGSSLTRLTRNKVWDCSPSWSPDGTKLAFSRYNSRDLKDTECYNADVWVMNADGTQQRRLTHDEVKHSYDRYANEDDPAWSPDGRKIYFDEWSGPSRIFVMNANGGSRSLVYEENK